MLFPQCLSSKVCVPCRGGAGPVLLVPVTQPAEDSACHLECSWCVSTSMSPQYTQSLLCPGSPISVYLVQPCSQGLSSMKSLLHTSWKRFSFPLVTESICFHLPYGMWYIVLNRSYLTSSLDFQLLMDRILFFIISCKIGPASKYFGNFGRDYFVKKLGFLLSPHLPTKINWCFINLENLEVIGMPVRALREEIFHFLCPAWSYAMTCLPPSQPYYVLPLCTNNIF